MRTIGIDLGTTNSLVAVVENGVPKVICNEFNEYLTPSAVAVAEDGHPLVGRAAKDRLVQFPESGKAFFKRDMGTQTTYQFGKRHWTPIENSALILQEMKRIAERYLREKVSQAVITVPAYFRENQRQATLEAGHIAGLAVSRIINEPTAAALAYGYRDPEKETRLLVFDIGGGTFDVTILDIFDGIFEVTASGGESHLGGEDYTDALLDHVLKKCGLNKDDVNHGRLRQQMEVIKRRLAVNKQTGAVVEGHELVIRREDFEEAGKEFTARLRPIVLRCLRDARVDARSLDDILLVGGASRMPLIQSFVQRELGREGRHLLDPDQVVALGAAVQAALCEENEAVQDLVLTDVCSHTLGISVAKTLTPGHDESGYFEPLIDRNTTVPTSKSKIFTTMHPGQDQIEVEIYQGEARMVRDNHLLGKLKVPGLRKKPGQRNEGQVDIRFSYDMNGLLEVEATVLHSNQKFSTVIEQRPGSMTPQQIQAAIARLSPLKIHPRNLVHNRARLERANRLFEDLKGIEREQLVDIVETFESALEGPDEAIQEETGRMLDELLARYYREEGERQSPEE